MTAVLLTGEPAEPAAGTPVAGIEGGTVLVTFPDGHAVRVTAPDGHAAHVPGGPAKPGD